MTVETGGGYEAAIYVVFGVNRAEATERLGSVRSQSYDTLAKVYSLYATLSGNAHLIEFSFILGWPDLKQEQKREKYSKYACHELNFFLYTRIGPSSTR